MFRMFINVKLITDDGSILKFCYHGNVLSLIFQVEFYVSHCNTLFSREFDILGMVPSFIYLILSQFTFYNFLSQTIKVTPYPSLVMKEKLY